MIFLNFGQLFPRIARNSGSVRVFPILFGVGNRSEMQSLGAMTGGRTFDGHKHALNVVFKKIRGYQ